MEKLKDKLVKIHLLGFDRVAEIHPAGGQGPVRLRTETVFLTDLASFKGIPEPAGSVGTISR